MQWCIHKKPSHSSLEVCLQIQRAVSKNTDMWILVFLVDRSAGGGNYGFPHSQHSLIQEKFLWEEVKPSHDQCRPVGKVYNTIRTWWLIKDLRSDLSQRQPNHTSAVTALLVLETGDEELRCAGQQMSGFIWLFEGCFAHKSHASDFFFACFALIIFFFALF